MNGLMHNPVWQSDYKQLLQFTLKHLIFMLKMILNLSIVEDFITRKRNSLKFDRWWKIRKDLLSEIFV